jgi:hypothetical protein
MRKAHFSTKECPTSSAIFLHVIVKGIGHPLIEKGKCHHYEKGDIELERTEAVVGLQ